MTSSITPAVAPILIAKFNPLIKPFLVMTIGCTMAVTLIGLPLALIWFLGAGPWWARHYYDKLECHLDERTLRFRKGILVQTEKTIPLENIQDVTFVEGPILRHFHLATLKFETAGHSAGQAGDMHLTGIIDAHDFRNQILIRREALKNRAQAQAMGRDAAFAGDQGGLQLAALQGIERRMDELIALLRERR